MFNCQISYNPKLWGGAKKPLKRKKEGKKQCDEFFSTYWIFHTEYY